MTDTTPEPTEARIPIDDAREQLLDLLEESATATYDAEAGILYVVSDEIQESLTLWRGYKVVHYIPDPADGTEDTETDEHPDADETTPEIQPTDAPDYDEAQQQVAEGNWVTNLDQAEPRPFDADNFADPDMTDEERDAFMAALEEDKQLAAAVERAARPRVIYSTINDGLGNEQVVGWDTCGRCLHHIRICECDGGPHRPSYVEKFAFAPEPERKTYEPGGDMVKGTMHAGVLRGDEDDADMVITVVDTQPDVSPTGRRRRKDAGKPRGQRDAQATQAAAEDLAAAIKDRSSDG